MKTSHLSIRSFVLVACLIAGVNALPAQGTAFTYQGKLDNNGSPANGIYDFRFRLSSDSLGNTYVGGTLLSDAVPVSNGLFAVTLDFGANFPGADRWLEIGVRSNLVGSYTTLLPLQSLTPTPYAIFSGGSGSVSNGLIQNPLFLGTTAGNPLELYAGGQRVLRFEPTATSPNIIGGFQNNSIIASADAAVVVGGGRAGAENRGEAELTFIGGGWANTNGGGGAFLGGGFLNRIDPFAFDAVIAGGRENRIGQNDFQTAIGGGYFNRIGSNTAYSVIAGGLANTMDELGSQSIIAGGGYNTIGSNTTYSVIAGGYANVIESGVSYATISGGARNIARTGSHYSVTAGGLFNTNGGPASIIAGGENNFIQSAADRSAIGGGRNNVVQGGTSHSVIGGGYANATHPNADYSVTAGGALNTNGGYIASIGGGQNNFIQDLADHSVIGGGGFNTIVGDFILDIYATIGGGRYNAIRTNTPYATIAGGIGNTVAASSSSATVGGGNSNTTAAAYATVPGGDSNAATGPWSFAAGRRAKANHQGGFVWGDSTDADFTSTATNQFSVRAAGGVRLETAGAGATLDGQPILSGMIGSAQLADNAVTTLKLADGSVTALKLANNSVGSSQLADSINLGDAVGAAGSLTLYRGVAGGPGIELVGTSGAIVTYGSDGLIQTRLYNGIWGELDLFDNVGNDQTVLLSASSDSGGQLFLRSPTGVERLYLYGDFNGTARIGIGRSPVANALEVNGEASKSVAGNWLANSDRRIKTDVHPLSNALEVINRLRPVAFHYDEKYREGHTEIRNIEYYNVVAQEFAEVFPESVQKGGDKLPSGDAVLQVDTYPATIYSIAAIQELDHELNAKEVRIRELEKTVNELKELVGKLAVSKNTAEQ